MNSVSSNAVASKYNHNLVYNALDKNLTGNSFPQEFYRKQFAKGLYLVSVSFYIQSTNGFDYIDVHTNFNQWYEKALFTAGWMKYIDVLEFNSDEDIYVEAYGVFAQNGDSYTITSSSVQICCLKTF